MAGFYIGNIFLGEEIFYSESADHYVLAPSISQAEEVLTIQGLPATDIKHACTLTEASRLLHRLGARVTVVHNGYTHVVDTVLALGVPKGLDTTKPCHIIYRRN